jgi:hypothetical protein
VAFLLTFAPAIYLASTSGDAPLSVEGAHLYADVARADASLEEVYLALADEMRSVRRENRRLSTARCGSFAWASPR